MSLHYRLRGEVWHVRGTIRVGRQTIEIPSHSTGCRTRRDAESAGEGEADKIRRELLNGKPVQRRHTITEAILAYTHRPKAVPDYDLARLEDFMARIGEHPVDDASAAWGTWLATRGRDMAPATAARSRAILQAALNHGASALRYAAPKLPTVAQRSVEGAVYLTMAEQGRLLASYNRWAWAPVLVLCYQGMRSQEALRMDWRHVSLERATIHLPAQGTKSGKGRTVPMHPRVRWALAMLWHSRERPDDGAVFLSHRGCPYADTRGLGGNPLAQAHATACAKAGVTGFRVHDWRHHWASHMVMSGCDLPTLMRLGGWTSPRMVQRYAAVSGEHMATAIARLA
jgi:integrase